MSPLRAFFMPFTLFLGAVIFFLIFNPGIIFSVIGTFISLIFSNWLVGAIVALVVMYFVFSENEKVQ